MPGECEIEADATICNGCCGNAYFREYECAGGGSTIEIKEENKTNFIWIL